MRAATPVRDLPSALQNEGLFDRQLAGRRPAVFLDYDGVLTPIVDRPQDAVLSDDMRATVRALARRCPVCIVSGRDRTVVQELMGINDLVVAGSHGFDIWTPQRASISDDTIAGVQDLIAKVTDRLCADVGSIPGVQVEPKRASVAVHYRLVAPEDRSRVAAAVQALLAEHPDELKVTPGKMVLRASAEHRLEQGQGRPVPDRRPRSRLRRRRSAVSGRRHHRRGRVPGVARAGDRHLRRPSG